MVVHKENSLNPKARTPMAKVDSSGCSASLRASFASGIRFVDKGCGARLDHVAVEVVGFRI